MRHTSNNSKIGDQGRYNRSNNCDTDASDGMGTRIHVNLQTRSQGRARYGFVNQNIILIDIDGRKRF